MLKRTSQTPHMVAVSLYVVGSKSFRPDIQNLRQMENAVRDIQGVPGGM